MLKRKSTWSCASKLEVKKYHKRGCNSYFSNLNFWNWLKINFLYNFLLKIKISFNMITYVPYLKEKVLVKSDSLDFTLLGSMYGDTGCCKSQDKLKGFSIIIVVITSIVHTLLASQGNIVRALISINFQEKGTRRLLNNKKCECVHSQIYFQYKSFCSLSHSPRNIQNRAWQ